jgi:hypothetical protein
VNRAWRTRGRGRVRVSGVWEGFAAVEAAIVLFRRV